MKYRFVLFGSLLLSCYSAVLSGQTAAGVGGLTGVVLDPSGGAIAGAHVVVQNGELGIRRDLTTTNGGVFNAPALVPHGGYEVTVDAAGFAEFDSRNITVLVGHSVNVVAKLEIKSAATQIEVKNTTPLTEIKTDVSDTVTQKQIDSLPINGRRVDQFVLLSPAVVPDGTFGDLSFRGTPGGNTFLVDGNDTTDQFYDENAGRTRIPTQISQDAVQEFQALSDAYSAEYGRAIGGIVNTVTRSGTNDFHGTGFWFFRNRTLDARDRYASINPSEVRNQFGGTLSGPIVKDKLFFLLNTEEQLRDFPLVSSILNPSVINPRTRTWNGCGVSSGSGSSFVPAASASQCAAINGLLSNFFQTLPRTANQQTAFGKIDWRPDDKNSFSFSFNYQSFYAPNGIQTGATVTNGGALNSNGNDSVQDRYGRVEWTFVPTGNIVNEARFGWFKDRQADDINNSLINPLIGVLNLTVNGQSIGFANYLPRVEPSENRFEGADNLSWTVGKHNFKFGFDIPDTEDYINQLINQFGAYTYSSANAFALDYSGPTRGTARYYTRFVQAFGNPIVDLSVLDTDFYAQDQYRALPSLTLYYGVRYERSALPQPQHQYVNRDFPATGRINESNLNFAPRIGFAWSPDAQKTVIRGGYGIYYGRYYGGLLDTLLTNNNNYQQSITVQPSSPTAASAGPIFPGTLTNAGAGKASGLPTVEFAASNLRTPYTEQADFAIQRALDSHTSMTVSYLWSRGARFFTVRDNNLRAPSGSATYSILNAQGQVAGHYTTPEYLTRDIIYPNYQHVYEVDNGGNSYYNGLTLQIQRRFVAGFEGSLAYTWSHAIDTNLGGSGNNLFYSSPTNALYNGDYQGVKGSSSLDQRHRLVVNWVWSPRFTQSTSAWARYLVNNWQLSSITTIASQLPATETVNVLSSPSGLAFPGTNITGLNQSSQVPFLGINTLRIDDTWNVSARLSKTLPITEKWKVTLQFEAFNLTNTITNTSISTTGYNASYKSGTYLLTPAAGLGTGTQSGGFPDGTNARREQASLRIDF